MPSHKRVAPADDPDTALIKGVAMNAGVGEWCNTADGINRETMAFATILARAVFSRLDALGYAVVPKEPTPEMVEAGSYERNIEGASAEAVYRAMLDKAMEGPK